MQIACNLAQITNTGSTEHYAKPKIHAAQTIETKIKHQEQQNGNTHPPRQGPPQPPRERAQQSIRIQRQNKKTQYSYQFLQEYTRWIHRWSTLNETREREKESKRKKETKPQYERFRWKTLTRGAAGATNPHRSRRVRRDWTHSSAHCRLAAAGDAVHVRATGARNGGDHSLNYCDGKFRLHGRHGIRQQRQTHCVSFGQFVFGFAGRNTHRRTTGERAVRSA